MKKTKKKAGADFRLARALVIGALLLAAVSWWLPGHFRTPLTADMTGTVEKIQEAYNGYRLALCLEDNSVKYTLPTETFLAMEPQPQPGDEVGLTYEVTSLRNIRELKVLHDDGTTDTLYTSEDPVAKQLYFWQTVAFAVYGVFFALCVWRYCKKGHRRDEDGEAAAQA